MNLSPGTAARDGAQGDAYRGNVDTARAGGLPRTARAPRRPLLVCCFCHAPAVGYSKAGRIRCSACASCIAQREAKR